MEADEAVHLGIALAKVPQDRWNEHLLELLAPMVAALPDAVAELKALLRGAASAEDQPARERQAQMRRLASLRALMGG